jgi:uncharacterized membrane protein YgdD (TMEM256/DUF423 family)
MGWEYFFLLIVSSRNEHPSLQTSSSKKLSLGKNLQQSVISFYDDTKGAIRIMDLSKIFLATGAAVAGLSVVFGAFGAHLLKSRLTVELLNVFEVGVRYQLYHGLALCVLGTLALSVQHSLFFYSGLSFLVGTLIFSGSLYLLALTGIGKFGAVTPIGGIVLIMGWMFFLLGAWNLSR